LSSLDGIAKGLFVVPVMGNPNLGCGPDLDVAVQYVAEPVTQP